MLFTSFSLTCKQEIIITHLLMFTTLNYREIKRRINYSTHERCKIYKLIDILSHFIGGFLFYSTYSLFNILSHCFLSIWNRHILKRAQQNSFLFTHISIEACGNPTRSDWNKYVQNCRKILAQYSYHDKTSTLSLGVSFSFFVKYLCCLYMKEQYKYNNNKKL